MRVIPVNQGSAAWMEIRAQYFTASEAPIMMGASSKASRSDLLRMKATGDEKEFSRWVREVLFERGHEVEAKARAIAEEIIGEELYPATATDGDGVYLASFDGITLLEDVIWECKQANKEKASIVRDGGIPDEDKWQIVHQLVVSRAEKCLYMVTDGTKENTVSTWFTLSVEDEDALHRGWKQFAIDLDAYKPRKDPAPSVGRAPESLPALRIEVQGMVTASNLAEFREHALGVIHSVNTDLQTDQHFADAEQCVKFFKNVEDRLDAAKQHALSQTESIDELFRTIDGIKEEARAKRLQLDKLVKARKEAIRGEILTEGRVAIDTHIAALNKSLGGNFIPIDANFAEVMKGKKTVKSLRDAVDQELARAKIAANEISEIIRGNLARFSELASEYSTLFPDRHLLVLKDRQDMEATIKVRISEHETREHQRLEAERERIRQEEQQKLEAEQRRKEQEATRKAAAERQIPTTPQEDVVPQQIPTPRPNDASLRNPGPRSLRMALSDWQQAHGINDDAMDDLLGMLTQYEVLSEAA